MKLDINDLEKIELLGSGVSGQVHKVISKTNQNKYFALKIIPLKSNTKLQEFITNEVQTLHGCKCENIVKCYASFYNVI